MADFNTHSFLGAVFKGLVVAVYSVVSLGAIENPLLMVARLGLCLRKNEMEGIRNNPAQRGLNSF